MAKKLKIDFNEPATKRVKFDPALKDGSICKKKLGDFPDEILLKILGYVDTINQLRLQQVNKRFRDMERMQLEIREMIGWFSLQGGAQNIGRRGTLAIEGASVG